MFKLDDYVVHKNKFFRFGVGKIIEVNGKLVKVKSDRSFWANGLIHDHAAINLKLATPLEIIKAKNNGL